MVSAGFKDLSLTVFLLTRELGGGGTKDADQRIKFVARFMRTRNRADVIAFVGKGFEKADTVRGGETFRVSSNEGDENKWMA